MRHFICMSTAALTPASHALCVFVSTQTAALIAPASLTLQAHTGASRASLRAVALTPITVAANHNLGATAGAQKHTGWFVTYSVWHKHPRQAGACWTTTVPQCHNCVALVSNTVKGAAVGSNCQVRAAAAPAYSSVWALLQRTGLRHFKRRHEPKTQTPQSWERPSGLSHDWFPAPSSSRKKTLPTVRKERFLAVVHKCPFNQGFGELLEDAILANQVFRLLVVRQQRVYEFGG